MSNSYMIHDVTELTASPIERATRANGEAYYVRRLKITDEQGGRLEITLFSETSDGTLINNAKG